MKARHLALIGAVNVPVNLLGLHKPQEDQLQLDTVYSTNTAIFGAMKKCLYFWKLKEGVADTVLPTPEQVGGVGTCCGRLPPPPPAAMQFRN